jgi:hypothetical protein
MSAKKPIPFVYWPLWMTLLGLALVVFYVFLTPIWMGIRLVAWLSERGSTVFDSGEAGK